MGARTPLHFDLGHIAGAEPPIGAARLHRLGDLPLLPRGRPAFKPEVAAPSTAKSPICKTVTRSGARTILRYSTCILRGLACSAFGSTIVTTPSFISALILLWSILFEISKLRA